jgi:hypothetical protein
MYGFYDENSGIVLREYQHWYPDQRQPIRYLFAVVHCSLRKRIAFMPPAQTGCSRHM